MCIDVRRRRAGEKNDKKALLILDRLKWTTELIMEKEEWREPRQRPQKGQTERQLRSRAQLPAWLEEQF